MSALPAPTQALTAVQCPSPPVNAAITYLAAAFNSSGPGTPGSPGLVGGDSSLANSTSSNFNQLSAYVFLAATYGGGSFGVLHGLTMTSASGLLLTVNAGQALVGGFAELTQGGTITVPDNTAKVWIWLKAGVQNNTGSTLLSAVATSLSPPAGQWALLGVVTTSAGAITAVDTSGVVYLANGAPYRTTADTAAPSDNPGASSRIQTYTQGGLFHWDGAAYHQAVQSASLRMTSAGVSLGGHLSQSYNVQAITGTLALTVNSPNIQRLTCASGQIVTMPSNASSNFGMSFAIYNDNTGGGSNITLKDSTGTTTIATINPGYMVTASPMYSGGSPAWPAALTPVPI